MQIFLTVEDGREIKIAAEFSLDISALRTGMSNITLYDL